MKSFFLAVFCLCLSLHAEDEINNYDEGEKILPPITIKAYATFLKESPVENNFYQLYHPPMERQLLEVNAPPSAAEESDSHDYIIVDGEEDAPMCGLTDLDVRCYEEGVKKNQPEGTTNESLNEPSSPLMMEFEREKKVDPKQNEQNERRNMEYDPSQTVQRGHNGASPLAGRDYNQERSMNTAKVAPRGPQLIDARDMIADIERNIDALKRGEPTLPVGNMASERIGLLAGRSVQQVEPEPDSSCLPRLRDALFFCFPCLRRAPVKAPEEMVAMAPVTRADGYGAVATAEPNFSEKLKAVLTNQKFKAERGAPAQELQIWLNDGSVSSNASKDGLIADLVSDGAISTKDLMQLVRYLNQLPATPLCTQKKGIIQAVIDQRKQEVAEQLHALSLENLYKVDKQVHQQISSQVALLFSPGSRIGLPTNSANLNQAPGYSKIQDSSLYSSLVKKAVAEKTRIIQAAIATNKSTVIPRSMKPTQFLSFLDVDVDTRQVIGQGGFGKVYSAQNRVTQEPLVYKEELRSEGVTQGALHRDIKTTQDLLRQGDIAAAALLTLPHFVEAEALIVKVISNNGTSELHYVPAANAGRFIDSLENVKDIQIIGQLMKKAPGKPLRSILNSPEWKALSLTERLEHFDAIMQQSFEYFSHAYGENFVHRDIKPENIIYDMATKKLTIIDAGLATKLDVEPTMVERAQLLFAGKSPIGFKTTSEVQAGTELYLAPAIKQGLPHGPEVDAHAFGKVFVELIDPDFSFQLIRAAHQNKEEIKDVQAYRTGLANNQQLFSGSPLNNFLQQARYEKKVALIDAFFNLGSYVNTLGQTNWRSSRFEALKTAYAAAYPVAATKK